MAIETDSEQWQSVSRDIAMVSQVHKSLSSREDEAFTVEEVASILYTTRRESIPEPLRDAYQKGNETPLVNYVLSALTHLQWQGHVIKKIIDEGDGPTEYYTWSPDGNHLQATQERLCWRLDILEQHMVGDLEIDFEDVEELEECLGNIGERLHLLNLTLLEED